MQPDVRQTGRISLPESCDSFMGMMCVVIVGVWHQRNLFIVRFHFGELWGDHGYGYLPVEYIAKLGQDFWVIDMHIREIQLTPSVVQGQVHPDYYFQLHGTANPSLSSTSRTGNSGNPDVPVTTENTRERLSRTAIL